MKRLFNCLLLATFSSLAAAHAAPGNFHVDKVIALKPGRHVALQPGISVVVTCGADDRPRCFVKNHEYTFHYPYGVYTTDGFIESFSTLQQAVDRISEMKKSGLCR